ncbi:MAG: hypothetical protein A2252_05285 [Elusimicrobia bacterium RIFOXYA2_FULL_39_19]|nr:MAG: hypothetical protein A2252_05285 [Elusimicrobia bacterium RIFOXYA2_FULL_39_19]
MIIQMGAMFKKYFIYSLILFIFTGCSPNGSNISPKKVIQFVMPGSDSTYVEMIKPLIKKFEAQNPDIDVIFQPISGQRLRSKIFVRVASERAPDVCFIDPMDMLIFLEKDVLLELDSLIEKDRDMKKSDFFPFVIESMTWNGNLYGLTDGFTPLVIYYNKTIFDDAGLKYPDGNWDWYDFLEIAKKLTIRADGGTIKQFGGALYDEDVLYFINAWRGSLWNKTKTKCIIDTPEARAGVQFLVDLIIKHKVIPNLTDNDSQSGDRAFKAGRVGMFLGGMWYTPNFKKDKTLKWGICEIPKGKVKVSPIFTHMWSILKQTKHPNESYRLVKFLCSPESQLYLLSFGDSVPSNIKVAQNELSKENPDFPEDRTVYLKSLAYAVSFKKDLHHLVTWGEIDDYVWGENIEKMLLNHKAVADYTREVQKYFNGLIKKYKNHPKVNSRSKCNT